MIPFHNGPNTLHSLTLQGLSRTVPGESRPATDNYFQAEDVKVESVAPDQPDQVFAYGQLPDSTIQGWFPIGDLDELEKKLKENGEL